MNIREKKGKKDQDTSKIYAKFGIEIYAAAKSGEPNPELNQKLAFVVDRAKTYNVPRHIIDKAIEKAKGGDDENYQELRYEGFGPNGSMIIVDALSNNVNRTAANVRAIYNKNGGNMGVSGAVSYLFDNLSVFVFDKPGESDPDEMLLALLEEGVEVRDVEMEDDSLIVYGEPNEFNEIRQALLNLGISSFEVAELEMVAKNEVTLSDGDLVKFEKLLDALDDDEDVQNVYHNVILD